MKTLPELLAQFGIKYDLPAGVLSISDPRLTPTQLTEIRTLLVGEDGKSGAYGAHRAPTEGAPALQTLKDIRAFEADIRGQETARADAAAQIVADAAELAALDAAAAAPAAPAAPVEPVVDPAAPVAAVTDPATPPAPVAIIGQGVVVAQTPDELAKVAAVQAPEVKLPAAVVGAKPTASFVTAGAGLNISGQLGTPIQIHQIGPELTSALRSMQEAADAGRQAGPVNQVVLASLPAFIQTPGFDHEGILSTDKSASANTAIITQVLGEHGKRLAAAKAGTVHTAAAPWCEPFDTIRTLPTNVTTDTPVRNSLPFIPMGYGGFQFNQGYSFNDLWGAVDIWTAADQAAIDPTDPDTWKRCMQLTCPGELPTVSLDDWLTACIEWQVGMDLNNPERFRQAFELLEGVRARLVEQYTLSMLDVLMMNFKNSNVRHLNLGGVPDLVAALIAMIQGSQYNGRTAGRSGYTMYLDTDMLDTLVVSEVRAAHAKTDATKEGIKRYIMSKVDILSAIIEVKDRIPGAYGTVATNGNPKANANFPADNQADFEIGEVVTAGRIRIIPTAEVFAFGTGEMRTGARQDYSYARQNKVGWFAEEAFALTKFGTQPWFGLNATINPRGYYIGAINRNATATESEASPTTWTANNGTADEPDPNP